MSLSKYRGRDVLSIGVEIRNAAGGLNDALKVDPEEYEVDDEITVVMRCVVDKHRHEKVKDTDGLRLVHILSANEAAVIDDALVAEVLDRQSKRIEAAKIQREQEKGIFQLSAAMTEAHEEGAHADELVEGCPACDAEAEAVAADGG